MKRVPDIAIAECVRELRGACRMPIDEPALEMLVGMLRPNFERILGTVDGNRRWTECGQRMRDNARHLGGFADFFGGHAGSEVIGFEELKRAFQVVRADCTVRAERTPVAWEFCREVPIDASQAEEFLQAVAPIPETA